MPRRAPAAAAPRRGPGTVINYHYLANDIRMLALLAPSMVIVLIIAYIVHSH